jgi:hypothetical protein
MGKYGNCFNTSRKSLGIHITHHLLKFIFHFHVIKKVNNNGRSSKEKQNQKQEEIDENSFDVPVAGWN